jgi:hypothetical protein
VGLSQACDRLGTGCALLRGVRQISPVILPAIVAGLLVSEVVARLADATPVVGTVAAWVAFGVSVVLWVALEWRYTRPVKTPTGAPV